MPAQLWEGGGNPILFQHLFWFYSHPAVYIFILPGLGSSASCCRCFPASRSSATSGSLCPACPSHWSASWSGRTHVRVGHEHLSACAFHALHVAGGGSNWRRSSAGWARSGVDASGRRRPCFSLGAISVFLIGGLTGPPLGTVTTDLQLHDTYYVVGHFHATMFGGFVFPFFAALYWVSKSLSGASTTSGWVASP